MIKTLVASTALAALALPAAAQNLTVFDYSGYELPEYHQAFIDAHGGSPEFVFFGDEDEAFQRLVSGFQADVSHICAGSVPRWQESGIIEPWDTSRIEAFATLNSDLVGEDVLAGSEEMYFLPIDFGSTGVAYNTDAVPADDVASLEVFNNPAYAGRLSLPDNVDDAYALAYLATGVTDWTDATEEQFEAATEWLRGIHPNIRTYWVDPAEIIQLHASGEVLVSWSWNEVPVAMLDEGYDVAYARETVEGTSVWLCGYVNMVDSPGDEDQAYDYVNSFLSLETAAPLLENGFASANTAALEPLGTEALDYAGVGEVSVPVLAQLPISNEQRQAQAEMFERIKAGF